MDTLNSNSKNQPDGSLIVPIEPVVVVFDSNPQRELCRKIRQQERTQRQFCQVPELVFVNSSTVGPRDKTSSRLVRTHVMRDYVWRKRQRAQEKHVSQVRPERNALFRSVASPFPSLRGLDNAAMYPIHMNSRTFLLLQYYFEIVVEKFDLDELLRLSLTDAALFHMVLLSSAVRLNYLSSNQNALENDFHKLSAIKLVKERLQNWANNNHLVPDSLILTVAFLAISEALTENYETCAIHINGLYKIVDMLGGLDKISVQLQYRIRMADIFCCIKIGSTPRFTMSDISDQFYHALSHPSHPHQLYEIIPSTQFERVILGVFLYAETLKAEKASPTI